MGSVCISRPHGTQCKFLGELDPVPSRHLVYKILYVIDEKVTPGKASRFQIEDHVVK